jgi:hypothetical protein
MEFQQMVEKKFKCDECSKSYDQQKMLKRHIRDTHRHKFPCTVAGCTLEFARKDNRDRHSKLTDPKHHIPGKNLQNHGEVRYYCTVPGCNQFFRTRSTRNVHSRNILPHIHDPKYYEKKLAKRNQVKLKKNLKILTSFSGKANGKRIDEEHLKKNSSSIPFETIEDSNNGIFTKKTFLLSNSYLNQYLFAAKKMPDPVRLTRRECRHLSVNVEREKLNQQRELKYQKFWEKIDKTKMDKECQSKFNLMVSIFIFVIDIKTNTFHF